MDIKRVRELAGLPRLAEATTVNESHEAKEKAMFEKACGCLTDIVAMCEQRLKDDLSPEHKKQYESLKSCATQCCDTMKTHVDSYK